MSCRARRLTDATRVEPFAWDEGGRPSGAAHRTTGDDLRHAAVPVADAAAIERDAFAKGYAQGERAGADAAAVRAEAMLRRLAGTIEEIQAFRGEIVQKTERQVVQLALAIAQRVINREISLDRDLLVAMARVALDRLADTPSATIRLHPEDYAAAMARQSPGQFGAGSVRMVADPAVTRGGCLVQSEFGLVDVSAAAQLHELAVTLLGDDDSGVLLPVTVNVQH